MRVFDPGPFQVYQYVSQDDGLRHLALIGSEASASVAVPEGAALPTVTFEEGYALVTPPSGTSIELSRSGWNEIDYCTNVGHPEYIECRCKFMLDRICTWEGIRGNAPNAGTLDIMAP